MPHGSPLPQGQHDPWRRHLDADLAAALHLARKRRGLTLRQAARRAAISPSYLSRLERGLRAPRLATIVRLERALDLDEETVERLIDEADCR